MTLLVGDRIAMPDFGDELELSFEDQTFDNTPGPNYVGVILVRYYGTRDHKPAACLVSRASEDEQDFALSLGEGKIIEFYNPTRNEDGSPQWAQSHDPVLGSGHPEFSLYCSAEYVSPSGRPGLAPDRGVKITGWCYTNGVRLLLKGKDYGAPGTPDSGIYSNKHVEVFFPLTYDVDYTGLSIGNTDLPPRVTIRG